MGFAGNFIPPTIEGGGGSCKMSSLLVGGEQWRWKMGKQFSDSDIARDAYRFLGRARDHLVWGEDEQDMIDEVLALLLEVRVSSVVPRLGPLTLNQYSSTGGKHSSCKVCGVHVHGYKDAVWTSGGHGWHCIRCWGWFLRTYVNESKRRFHIDTQSIVDGISPKRESSQRR